MVHGDGEVALPSAGEGGCEEGSPACSPRTGYTTAARSANLLALRNAMSCCVVPSIARSVRISPITGANLKPRPEKPQPRRTPG